MYCVMSVWLVWWLRRSEGKREGDDRSAGELMYMRLGRLVELLGICVLLVGPGHILWWDG